MERHRFEVRRTWNGEPLRPDESAWLELRLGHGPTDPIEVEVEATDYGDPPPAAPAGRCDGLWNHEVVELFLLGDGDRYLELELGPHGHYLALQLAGRRRVVTSAIEVDFAVERRDGRWRGRARLAGAWRPPGLRAANAYAIHGVGVARRYLAWAEVPGEAPDFHRLECFPPLVSEACS